MFFIIGKFWPCACERNYYMVLEVYSCAPKLPIIYLVGLVVCFFLFSGALMFVAWITTVSIGVIVARFFKPVWSHSFLLGKELWFQVGKISTSPAVFWIIIASRLINLLDPRNRLNMVWFTSFFNLMKWNNWKIRSSPTLPVKSKVGIKNIF